MGNKLLEVILDEQKFPYGNMTLEERNYYLNIIKNCKDICDTKHKVGNHKECEIVQLRFQKEDNVVNINGCLTIGDEVLRENRCVDGNIFLKKNKILVDMHITRLCVEDEHKEYHVFDEFKLDKDILKRKSCYDFESRSNIVNVEDEMLKGRLK